MWLSVKALGSDPDPQFINLGLASVPRVWSSPEASYPLPRLV